MWRLLSLVSILFLTHSLQAAPTPAPFRKAQAVRADVEIFQEANFDSPIIQYINPGKFYYISHKMYGAFYKIKISDKVIGYVADSEIDIQGVGRLAEKPFVDDPDPLSAGGKKSKERERAEAEDNDEDDSVFKSHYHGLMLSLVNYHETTMDQLQVADLYAIGYRYIPFLSDFSSSISWDVNVAWGAPAYYHEKLGVDAQGFTAWTGAQIMNISVVDPNKTLHYGLGPFLKYANYEIKGLTKSYSLQELNFGILLEGGFIYHLSWVSFDLSLRYYWERENYGGIGLGFLF